MSVFVSAMDEGSGGKRAEEMFKGGTIIVADCSLGNVGQLSADLLISTLKMSKVGYIDDDALLPAIGIEAGKLAVNVEIFALEESSIFVMQQRAPIVGKRAEKYASKIRVWVEKSGFKVDSSLGSRSFDLLFLFRKCSCSHLYLRT